MASRNGGRAFPRIHGMLARFLVAVVLAAGAVVSAVSPAGAAVACTGAWPGDPSGGLYPEQRQAVESQAWWTQDGGSPEHFHLGLCLPDREVLDAAVTPEFATWVRVIMHDNPGKANYVSMVFKGTDYETTVQKCYLRNGPAYDNTCPLAASTGKGDWTCIGTCTKWVPFSRPLSGFGHTGLQEVRFRAFVPEPKLADGITREMHTSVTFQTTVTGTGKSVSNVSREPQVRGKGWYVAPYRYCEAQLVDGDPASAALIPDVPVSGTWSPVLEQTTHDSDDSRPVTHAFVTVDPDFHAEPPVVGSVLVDQAGELAAGPVAVNTTGLINGTHRLYQKVSCAASDLGGGVNEGVLSVPFIVSN